MSTIRDFSIHEILSHADLSDMPDVGGTNSDHDARYYTEAEIISILTGYLKLNQSTHQHVINGSPHFDGGLTIKNGEKLIFDGA